MTDSCNACNSVDTCPEPSSSALTIRSKKQEQKVDYEAAKLVLQSKSTITGENLFDHLVNVISRVIDERPTNVVDYFEQLSRDVFQRSHSVSACASAYPFKEPQFCARALAILRALKILPLEVATEEVVAEEEFREGFEESEISIVQSSESSLTKIPRYLAPNENVLQLLHFFSFCGLNFQIDEMFQLSWAMKVLQFHYSIKNARFWGRIYGLKKSYYIVETVLTKSEVELRNDLINSNLVKKMIAFIRRKDKRPCYENIDVDLIPGAAWQHYPNEDLDKMKPVAKPVPKIITEETFETLSEPFGKGLNRWTYFVTTSLSDKWVELPRVTPDQIKASRQIKKYLTGNLEANLSSFPLFPGVEKHYLRALIARITAGTYIAPNGFYKKTKENEGEEFGDELPLEEEEEEDYVFDNDALVVPDPEYKEIPAEDLTCPENWVHVRANILDQGRILNLNEELALKQLANRALEQIRRETLFDGEEGEEEGEELGMEDGEEEDIYNEEELPPVETGPELFALCSDDENDQSVPAWASRFSCIYSEINQMIIMRSNTWPGAYTFAYENFCDSIYVGWGQKYIARCFSLQNVPSSECVEFADTLIEAIDPTFEMEEKWRKYYERKFIVCDEMSDVSVEFDVDDMDDQP